MKIELESSSERIVAFVSAAFYFIGLIYLSSLSFPLISAKSDLLVGLGVALFILTISLIFWIHVFVYFILSIFRSKIKNK